MICRAGHESQSAPMRQNCRRFEEHQALFGCSRKDSPPAGILRQGRVIKIGIKAEQRKLKAVLAAGFSVAGSGAAPLGDQDWLDIELEAERVIFRSLSGLKLENCTGNKQHCQHAAAGDMARAKQEHWSCGGDEGGTGRTPRRGFRDVDSTRFCLASRAPHPASSAVPAATGRRGPAKTAPGWRRSC